jgi:HK97 family phage prohead protease
MSHEHFALEAFDHVVPATVTMLVKHGGSALRGSFERLGVDAMALRFRFRLLDGPRERDVLDQIQSGVLDSCSVGYTYNQEDVRYRGRTTVYTRVDLREISLVNRPAWYGTSIRAVPP